MSKGCGCGGGCASGCASGCGCCEGTEQVTPMVVANRPGLDALVYRAGTHSAFLETMKARLSSSEPPELAALAALTTREADDPAIALLDAWATVADVLTFYQERIANEGYLRTATERRSVLELARLVGYALRPGVAASVHLAFELEIGHEVEIPAGTRVQSTPGPGELPQPFETSDAIQARVGWNALKPRLTEPTLILPRNAELLGVLYFKGTDTQLKPNDRLLFVLGALRLVRRVETVEPQYPENRTRVTLQRSPAAKVAAFLRALQEVLERYGDPAAFGVDPEGTAAGKVAAVVEKLRAPDTNSADSLLALLRQALEELKAAHDEATKKGFKRLKEWIGALKAGLEEVEEDAPALLEAGANATIPPSSAKDFAAPNVLSLLGPLTQPASVPPANAKRVDAVISASDLVPRLLGVMHPELDLRKLYRAWANAGAPGLPVEVHALRLAVPPFGHNAPLEPELNDEGVVIGFNEWTLQRNDFPTEKANVVSLDGSFPQIVPGGWAVVDRPEESSKALKRQVITRVLDVSERTRADYGLTAKVTQALLQEPWLVLPGESQEPDTFATIRGTTVYLQSQRLELADAPMRVLGSLDEELPPLAGGRIELDGLYDGLEPGRWLIVAGERADVPGTSGVPAAELVMLAGVEHGVRKIDAGDGRSFDWPGDTPHTTLVLASPLAYVYKLDTVTIHGNVARATHGETVREVLGGGDASQALQRFTLRRAPLTFVSAPTPSGIESTLEVRVNDLLWHEVPSFATAGPYDRVYAASRDDESRTSVVFGNGAKGARLPTGAGNVQAVYRAGIGRGGNVAPGQINLLAAKPLGVKGVVNPLPATGGADAESRDQARRNAPLAVTGLDRLVSITDYADFTRTFAGIGKASAARLSDGRRRLVHVTIAGEGDIPISETSDLRRNLEEALLRFGDPWLPVVVETRRLSLLLLNARVRLLPDYLWEKVEPKIRAALLAAFAFDRRDLGQDALLSEAVSAIHSVPGVGWVDVDLFDAVDEDQIQSGEPPADKPRVRIPADLASVDDQNNLRPAELIYLSPALPETLILKELPA
jgi:uncharacterized phage protein gp47/JayE